MRNRLPAGKRVPKRSKRVPFFEEGTYNINIYRSIVPLVPLVPSIFSRVRENFHAHARRYIQYIFYTRVCCKMRVPRVLRVPFGLLITFYLVPSCQKGTLYVTRQRYFQRLLISIFRKVPSMSMDSVFPYPGGTSITVPN
jgi:hypothetical protein